MADAASILDLCRQALPGVTWHPTVTLHATSLADGTTVTTPDGVTFRWWPGDLQLSAEQLRRRVQAMADRWSSALREPATIKVGDRVRWTPNVGLPSLDGVVAGEDAGDVDLDPDRILVRWDNSGALGAPLRQDCRLADDPVLSEPADCEGAGTVPVGSSVRLDATSGRIYGNCRVCGARLELDTSGQSPLVRRHAARDHEVAL